MDSKRYIKNVTTTIQKVEVKKYNLLEKRFLIAYIPVSIPVTITTPKSIS